MLSVIEINSFLIKFLQLSHDGLDTNLSFNCNDGKMTVNLKATVTSTPGSERTDDGNCQHVKPSRLRHRKRRSEARIKAQNSKNNCTIDSETPSQLSDDATELVQEDPEGGDVSLFEVTDSSTLAPIDQCML